MHRRRPRPQHQGDSGGHGGAGRTGRRPEGPGRSGAVVFDAREARAAANTYLSSAGGTGAAGSDVTTTGNTVTVTMEKDVPTFMLSLVGLSTVHITVSGSAEAETGSN